MSRHRAPRRTYLVLRAVATFTSTLAFATVTLYRFLEAGLSPFELVIVGTAMEAAVFCAEIPTGVVADVVSRKASIVIGHLGMGIGMLLEGAFPSLWGILLAQVLWGVAYTFTSGATQAWLAGEVGEDDYADAMLAGSQVAYPAALLGLLASYGVAVVDLRVPLVAAGLLGVGLGAWLWLRMPETGFERLPRPEREGWHALARTTRAGVSVITGRRPLLLVAAAIVLWGAASEAFDRLGQPHLIEGVGLPQQGRTAELLWLGALSLAASVVGFAVTTWTRRRGTADDRARTMRWVVGLSAGHAVSVLVFGLAAGFAMGVVGFLAVRASAGLNGKLLDAWIVPLTDRRTRATTLSVLGQADAAGQSLVGPGLGWVGSAMSLPASMLAAAGLVAFTPGLVALAGRAERRPAAPDGRGDSGAAARSAGPAGP